MAVSQDMKQTCMHEKGYGCSVFVGMWKWHHVWRPFASTTWSADFFFIWILSATVTTLVEVLQVPKKLFLDGMIFCVCGRCAEMCAPFFCKPIFAVNENTLVYESMLQFLCYVGKRQCCSPIFGQLMRSGNCDLPFFRKTLQTKCP